MDVDRYLLTLVDESLERLLWHRDQVRHLPLAAASEAMSARFGSEHQRLEGALDALVEAGLLVRSDVQGYQRRFLAALDGSGLLASLGDDRDPGDEAVRVMRSFSAAASSSVHASADEPPDIAPPPPASGPDRLRRVVAVGRELVTTDDEVVTLVSVELWTHRVSVRLAHLRAGQPGTDATDALPADATTPQRRAWALRRSRATFGATVERLGDDRHTTFTDHGHSGSGSGGGHGGWQLWESTSSFRPGAPADATILDLTVRLADDRATVGATVDLTGP